MFRFIYLPILLTFSGTAVGGMTSRESAQMIPGEMRIHYNYLGAPHVEASAYSPISGNWDILILDMVELGSGDALSLAQTIGIVGTMILTL